MSRTQYLDLDDRTEDVRELMRGRPRETKDFLEKYELSWIYHECALEGMVLTHAELRQALDPSPGMVDSSMVHSFTEVRNQLNAIEFIKQEAKAKQVKYSLVLVKRLYEVLYSNLPNRMPVQFRRDMPLHRTYFHDIVQPVQIQPALEQLFHFMEIFPFSDLSGKVGRMMLNLILIRAGYMPLVIHSMDRETYYDALRLNATQFGQVMMESMDNALDNAFKFFLPNWNETSRRRAASE